jgi:hypothetical protein
VLVSKHKARKIAGTPYLVCPGGIQLNHVLKLTCNKFFFSVVKQPT